MLTITENARDYVRQIPSQPLLPSTAGLRISSPQAAVTQLTVRIEQEPHRGDKVFDYDGARIFLGPNALDAVRGKMLDAVLDDSGRIQFQLTPQAMAVSDAQVA